MENFETNEQIVYRPLIFSSSSDREMGNFESICAANHPSKNDLYHEQIADLAECCYPALKLGGTPTKELVEKMIAEGNMNPTDRWVYFPWKNAAARILDPKNFTICRTNRNKLKLTDAEQAMLGSKTILFVGLSVGQSAAYTFAMQRIGGHYHLADFDVLSLTNMNRLKASILDIGQLKTVIAARQIAEQDPYLEVECHHDGINAENLDKILGSGKIDLIVEECDSVPMKFMIRERASALGIPVIMETSDRGVVDVERFDLEPGKLPFHGRLGDLTAAKLASLSKEEYFGVLSKLVDYENISQGLKESYAAFGKEVLTWPQLGYEVTLGGATLAFVATKILLGKNMNSGRIYVDLETVFKELQ